MKKKNSTQAPIAEFIYPDGTYRCLEYPDQPIGLVRPINKRFTRPVKVKFHPPGEDWEASREAEDRPVNQAFLAQWRDRCLDALAKK